MDRKTFLKSLGLLALAGETMKLNALNHLNELPHTDKMPILFCGHGSPMNAIEENEFTKAWANLGKTLPKPKAVLCISAHWETKGTFVSGVEKPETIHDFGGFPQALFDVQYPAPGSPEFAKETKNAITKTTVGIDNQWGLDHGCWSVVKNIYPQADVPVFQMSLDYTQGPQYHYDLAKQLASLRKKGVLIIGSGNIVHNLGMIAWNKMNEPNYAYDWAIEANTKIKSYITSGNHSPLINYKSQGKAFDLAIPTPDHYLPLLYILGLKEENENISFFNDKATMGSLTMTSIKIDKL
ncbi:MAG: 4,5-DOPA dioxygenase extradiol [Bacteroidia bacterium]